VISVIVYCSVADPDPSESVSFRLSWIRILIKSWKLDPDQNEKQDPHQSEKQDPHQSEKQDPDPHQS
jgi:hypothetical protein